MGAVHLLGNVARKFAAPAIIRASKYWTPRAIAKDLEEKAPKRRVVAHQLEGLIENRKIVMLEASQARRFKQVLKRNRYTIRKSMPVVQGKCDATGQYCPSCILFFPEEIA